MDANQIKRRLERLLQELHWRVTSQVEVREVFGRCLDEMEAVVQLVRARGVVPVAPAGHVRGRVQEPMRAAVPVEPVTDGEGPAPVSPAPASGVVPGRERYVPVPLSARELEARKIAARAQRSGALKGKKGHRVDFVVPDTEG